MTNMNYVLLGQSGLRVSELCLGTMTFAGDHAGASVGKGDAKAILDLYRMAGGNFIDTANMYSMGASEKMVGDIIKPYRSEIVLASKYTMSMDAQDPNAGGMHRKNLVQALDNSLKRLQTDYIDLFWVHAWDRFTPTDEVLRALDDAVRAGKILHIGASNTPAWRVAEANTKAALRAQTPFSAVQVQYSLIERTIENDMTPMAEALGVSILAWSPLGSGLLTGKYLDGGGEDGRLKVTEYGKRFLNDHSEKIARLVVEIAGEADASAAQVSLAWLRAKNAIPVIGGTKKHHFEDAIGALDVTLTEDQIVRLDEATAPPPNQPGCLFPRINKMVYGEVFDRVQS